MESSDILSIENVTCVGRFLSGRLCACVCVWQSFERQRESRLRGVIGIRSAMISRDAATTSSGRFASSPDCAFRVVSLKIDIAR